MTPVSTFQPAARSHTSLLAAAEKRLLIRIAGRLPAWVNSDHLTGLGFVSLICAGACYWLAGTNRWFLLAVIGFLALNWFGDSLDGTLARVRNRERPRYGFYVDHVLDAVGMSFLMTGLAFSGYMSPAVGYAFLMAYLLLSIEDYLATYTLGTFHVSYGTVGPTELRILLSVGNLFLLRRPTATLAGQEFLLFDIGFAIGAVGVALILVHALARHMAQLYREETKS
jgi:archaetidylinositol phosphate synthase